MIVRQEFLLGDIGNWGSGGTPLSSEPNFYGGTIPWLIIEDLNDGVVTTAKKSITESGLQNSSAKLLEPGTLLIAMYGSIGKLGISGIRCATNQAIAFCQCDSNLVDTKFLFYYLLSARSRLIVQGRGGTQQNINQELLKSFRISLPPLPEQRRIAALLDKADKLRRTRRYAAQLSDTFLQAVFVRMFGDARANPKRLEKVTIDEVAEIIVPTRDKPKSFSGTIPWVTLPDLDGLFIGTARNLLTHKEAAEVSNRLMPANTVLLSCAGSLGKIVIATREVYANQQFYGLVSEPSRLNYMFLALQLKMFGEDFYFNLAGISTLGFFSKDKALGIKIILPPLTLQEKFARIVQQFERLRAQQREAERQAEHLFQTLLHRAFNGE